MNDELLAVEQIPTKPIPEQGLWRAVLHRALLDIKGTTLLHAPGATELTITQTIGWIGSQDFFTVCNLAGYDPHYVEERFLVYVNQRKEQDHGT